MLLGVGLLSGLGFWQLQRLAWKEGLLAQIAARRDAPPAPPPPRSEWAALKPDDYDYRPVVLRGVFDHAKESFLFRASATGAAGGGAGYEIVTPLRLDEGGVVFVNRGFVPAEKQDPSSRPQGQVAGEVTVKGLMRRPESRNLFTPPDEPDHNLWFTRDPGGLGRALGPLRFRALQRGRRFDAQSRRLAEGRRDGDDHPQQSSVLCVDLVRAGRDARRRRRRLRLAARKHRRT